MQYKVPRIPSFTGLEGIDLRVQQIQEKLDSELSFLQYSFGACNYELKQVGEDIETIPVCYVDNHSDPLDMRPFLDDAHNSYCFWDVGEPEIDYFGNLSPRAFPTFQYPVACIFVVNLDSVNADSKVAKSLVRQNILNFFGASLRFKGNFQIAGMIDNDIESIYEGFDIADPLLVLRDNVAAFRVEGLITFKQDCITDRDSNFSDWFLPSKDELNLMYENLHVEGVGGFGDVPYWSSSEFNSSNSYYVIFSDGGSSPFGKANIFNVRACRTFTAESKKYSLREIGPGGGLIFYIDGTTFYEATAADLSSGYAWSNITDAEIGTTGTAIGTGITNTAAIIAQAGHTDSAAKLCNDYTV